MIKTGRFNWLGGQDWYVGPEETADLAGEVSAVSRDCQRNELFENCTLIVMWESWCRTKKLQFRVAKKAESMGFFLD